MSYDLYLDFTSSVRMKGVSDFFAARANYKANGSQIIYQNDLTGVYFMLNFSEEKKGLLRRSAIKAHININYCRPSFFGLESEIEIAELLKRFPCQIHDPQMNGMGDGPYSREGFLRSWNAGNEFGTGAILSQSARETIWSLPSSELHRAWHWNYTQPLRQAACGNGQFVPQILYMNIAGHARTVAVWGDGLPTLLPPVDFVLVARPGPRGNEFGFVSWEQLTQLLTTIGYQCGPEGFNLNYLARPKAVVDFVENIMTADISELSRLSPDHVLDEELVSGVLAVRKGQMEL